MRELRPILVIRMPPGSKPAAINGPGDTPNKALLNCPNGFFNFHSQDMTKWLFLEINLLAQCRFDRSFQKTVIAIYELHPTHYIAAYFSAGTTIQINAKCNIWCYPKAVFPPEHTVFRINSLAQAREPYEAPEPRKPRAKTYIPREPKYPTLESFRGWIKKKVSVEQAEAGHLVSDPEWGPDSVPFGVANTRWTGLLYEMKPGDELWEFSTPQSYWNADSGRSGIWLVRNNLVVKWLTLVAQSDRLFF